MSEYIEVGQATILEKISALLSSISIHHKWNGTRLLSPESEYTSCLSSCQMTWDLGS